MGINKVIDRNGNTVLDLSKDTVSPNNVLSGVKFHGPDGEERIGNIIPNEIDSFKYTFFDYDGELLYTYTDDELDALTELPPGADHTNENLTFQGWNWTLEDLKSVDRTRLDRPIVGAHYITTDGKTYITLKTDINSSNLTERFYVSEYDSSNPNPILSVNWGDGSDIETHTIESSWDYIEHTFPSTNTEYIISISAENPENFVLGQYGAGTTNGRYEGHGVINIKLGNLRKIGTNSKIYYSEIEKINIPISTIIGERAFYSSMIVSCTVPADTSSIPGYFSTACTSLKSISLPKEITTITFCAFSSNYSLERIYLPDGLKILERETFRDCVSIENIFIPDSVTIVESYLFTGCRNLKKVKLPSNLTQIGDNFFSDCWSLEEVDIPNTVTKLAGSAIFQYCKNLSKIEIPDSVVSIFGSSMFYGCRYNLILDLSKQKTKVIELNSDPTFSSYTIIKVPLSLLEQYKTASFWSKYASRMVGV